MILEIQQGFKNIHSWDTDWLCSNAQLKWVYLHAEFIFPKKKHAAQRTCSIREL